MGELYKLIELERHQKRHHRWESPIGHLGGRARSGGVLVGTLVLSALVVIPRVLVELRFEFGDHWALKIEELMEF